MDNVCRWDTLNVHPNYEKKQEFYDYLLDMGNLFFTSLSFIHMPLSTGSRGWREDKGATKPPPPLAFEKVVIKE